MKIDKCKKLVCDLHNKKKYIVHIMSLKQALNNGLKLKRVHRIIEFSQKAWLKSYIDMNTELIKLAKDDFGKEGTKKCVIKRMIKFNDYKNCFLKDKVLLKSQQRFISKKHDVYTENINKIALSNTDDKRIVSSDKITSYPYGYKGRKYINYIKNI